MRNPRRWIAVVFAALVLFALLTSLFFFFHETDHDCSGENCPICAAIAVCQNTLNNLFKALVIVAVALAFVRGTILVAVIFRLSRRTVTPISLNVKLLN